MFVCLLILKQLSIFSLKCLTRINTLKTNQIILKKCRLIENVHFSTVYHFYANHFELKCEKKGRKLKNEIFLRSQKCKRTRLKSPPKFHSFAAMLEN
jgi:hypothetical protein